MDCELGIETFSIRWMILAGRVICTICLGTQSLVVWEGKFPHAHTCDVGEGDFNQPGACARIICHTQADNSCDSPQEVSVIAIAVSMR